MNLGELIKMLELFPLNAPVHNAPRQGHSYQGRKTHELAFVMCYPTIHYEQPTVPVSELLMVLKAWLGREVYGPKDKSLFIDESAPVYLVDGMHQAGTAVKGLMFTTTGIRVIPESSF